jgi:phage gpG-like protein
MPDVVVKLEGGKKFQAWLKSKKSYEPAVNQFFDRSAILIQQEGVKKAPIDTGRLRGSIKINKRKNWRRIGSNVSYAGKVESGATPRWLPVGTLQPWARRHGFPGGAQGDFLARYGIANPKSQSKSRDGQPYMRPAFTNFENRQLDKELKRLSKDIGAEFRRANK